MKIKPKTATKPKTPPKVFVAGGDRRYYQAGDSIKIDNIKVDFTAADLLRATELNFINHLMRQVTTADCANSHPQLFKLLVGKVTHPAKAEYVAERKMNSVAVNLAKNSVRTLEIVGKGGVTTLSMAELHSESGLQILQHEILLHRFGVVEAEFTPLPRTA